jgi:uncharacterized protein (DUF2147 family)
LGKQSTGTIDDDGKTEKSHVRIAEAGGTLSGRIEKIADPSKQSARCADCEGARKDQPVLGMTIIEGVRRSSGGEHWDSGTILDPNNGKTYKVRMTLKDGGRALDVRGYVGTPLLGRAAAHAARARAAHGARGTGCARLHGRDCRAGSACALRACRASRARLCAAKLTPPSTAAMPQKAAAAPTTAIALSRPSSSSSVSRNTSLSSAMTTRTGAAVTLRI